MVKITVTVESQEYSASHFVPEVSSWSFEGSAPHWWMADMFRHLWGRWVAPVDMESLVLGSKEDAFEELEESLARRRQQEDFDHKAWAEENGWTPPKVPTPPAEATAEACDTCGLSQDCCPKRGDW